MYFLNYRLANRRLDKSLRSVDTWEASTSSKAKASKHISNYHGGTFIILINRR